MTFVNLVLLSALLSVATVAQNYSPEDGAGSSTAPSSVPSHTSNAVNNAGGAQGAGGGYSLSVRWSCVQNSLAVKKVLM